MVFPFRNVALLFCAAAALLNVQCKSVTEDRSEEKRSPNIIYILADDLGYGDIGPYGQKLIETPNLDALAASGMIFTQHYTSAPVCAPSRYMLLTGQHSGHAYIRGNEEWRERGPVWDYVAMARDSSLEGQRPMPEGTQTLPMKLKSKGYATGMMGKWGLGAPHTHSIPTKMGFDYFYGYNCQRQAHTYYPLHLYENESRVALNNDTIMPHTALPESADPTDIMSYADFTQEDYAPDLMFKALSNFVDQQKDNPFFLYWATPIPHVPLQAPEKWVKYYEKKFGKEDPYLAQNGLGYFPHPSPRAAYAAMISYLDENIGNLIAQLKEAGIYEDTLIIFTSDNGPSYAGGADPEWFKSAGPFEGTYGKGKGFVYEGGIRVPMIASWPGNIPEGTRTDHISVQYDVLATLSELTGFSIDQDQDGISFLPSLLELPNQEQHEFLLWEFPEQDGQVAIRMGEYKLVRQHLKGVKSAPTLELYNLAKDPGETNNIATQHPEILHQAAEIFQQEHIPAVIPKFQIPLLENGLLAEE